MTTFHYHKWYIDENNEDSELTKILDTLVDGHSSSGEEMSENLLDNKAKTLSTEILRQIKTEVSNYESPSPSTSTDSVIVPYKSSPQYHEYETKVEVYQGGATQAPTECKVCGLPTNCFHYEVSSCNGCKTFFRRTIIMGKKHECRFKNSCNVRGGSRCRSCRYDQCILAGMDPTAIRFPQGFNSESAIQEVQRRKRVLIDQNANEAAVVPTKLIQRFEQTFESRVVDNLAYLEMKFRRLRESTFNATPFYDASLRELLKLSSQLGNADKYEKPANWPLPASSFDCTYKYVQDSVDAKKVCNAKHWLTTDLVLNIEYLKALPFFHELDLDDQEALTMHVGLVNAVLVQCWYSYLNNAHTLTLPDGRTPILHRNRKRLFLGMDPDGVIPMELEVFCRNIDPLYRVAPDPEEYFLLKAIIFCHSEAPGLSEHAHDVLEKHRELYASTLLKRMQGRLGTLPGARKYADILGLVEMFFHFAQRKREFHVLLNSLRQQRADQPKMQFPLLFERFVLS